MSPAPLRLRAFIDEAGQRARNGDSSAHFTMAAVVWADAWDPEAHVLLERIREQTGRRPGDLLHFQRLNHYQRLAACREIGACAPDLSLVTVTVCKRRIVSSAALNDDFAYMWTFRLLLERLSWLARERQGVVSYTLSHVIRFKKEKLEAYEAKLREPGVNIDWEHVIAPGRFNQPKADERLQLADLAASATWQAFEQQKEGFCEPRYLEELQPALYRYKNKTLQSYGVKVHPRPTRTDHAWLQQLL